MPVDSIDEIQAQQHQSMGQEEQIGNYYQQVPVTFAYPNRV